MLRTSVVLCLVVFSMSLLAESEGHAHAIREFIMNKIVNPIKNLIPHKENNTEEESTDNKERGHLAGIGRDVIKETSKTFTEIKKGIQRTFSRNTAGLDCNRTLSQGRVDTFKSTVQAIYPGTKWCGDGNISTSYDDLGKFSSTDRCCREHDLCPLNMAADEEKFDLVNTGLFTRSDCECDTKFYNCLKDAKSLVADSIGYTYFTVLGPQCFKQDYPIEDCATEKRGRCVDYVMDTNGERRYQWFDNPTF